MCKKIFISFLLVAIFNLLVGCYSSAWVTVPEYNQIEEEDKPDEIKVIAKDLKEYHFTKSRFHIESDTLYGKGKIILSNNGQPFEGKIALSNIKSIEVENFNLTNTIILSLGIAATTIILAYVVFAIGMSGMGAGAL